MKTVTLTIDDRRITAREGHKLLWAALGNGIYSPSLRTLRDKPEAACRLCFVEVMGEEQHGYRLH
jgi:formate dehydrogenase major subunit/NADH-quinone oxidoreductase subunit G